MINQVFYKKEMEHQIEIEKEECESPKIIPKTIEVPIQIKSNWVNDTF